MLARNGKPVELDIVGSTKFGRYPKISIEQTFNMIISDDWLVPYAGHQLATTILANGKGRGAYASIKYNNIIAVVDNGVYAINSNLNALRIATIETSSGDVTIAENNANQIAICDKLNIYIFNYVTNSFSKATIDFVPGYISFQDTRFVSVELTRAAFRLSAENDGHTWPSQYTGALQTKADVMAAAIPVPGRGNMLYVFGHTVTEPWFDTGNPTQLFPYQKSQVNNIDYGCLSAATIAFGDKMVVWLGANNNSGPVVMYSEGGEPVTISNDGINFKLAQLTAPQDSYGFLFKQDGHLIYQITFRADNLTLAYDFETQKIFTICDENMNYHIAKKVVFFNNKYYFISFVDGNLYEFSSDITTYNGKEIPRVRVTKNFRLPDSSRFIANSVVLPIEQGVNKTTSRVDISISDDGGETFSSYDQMRMNQFAHRKSQFVYYNLGAANDLVFQFRMWSDGRFVVGNGQFEWYQ